MLAVDYYERIGELVARAVLKGYYVGVKPGNGKITVLTITGRAEAATLWPDDTGILEATVEALTRALGEL